MDQFLSCLGIGLELGIPVFLTLAGIALVKYVDWKING